MSQASGEGTTYLLFQSGIRLALPTAAVAEILPFPQLDAVPAAASFVAGMMVVDGRATVVLDLARVLDGEPLRPGIHSHVMRLAMERPSIALLVDRCTELVPASAVEALPIENEATFNGCVRSQLVREGEMVALLLDETRLLTAAERLRIEEFADLEQRRLDELEPIS